MSFGEGRIRFEHSYGSNERKELGKKSGPGERRLGTHFQIATQQHCTGGRWGQEASCHSSTRAPRHQGSEAPGHEPTPQHTPSGPAASLPHAKPRPAGDASGARPSPRARHVPRSAARASRRGGARAAQSERSATAAAGERRPMGARRGAGAVPMATGAGPPRGCRTEPRRARPDPQRRRSLASDPPSARSAPSRSSGSSPAAAGPKGSAARPAPPAAGRRPGCGAAAVRVAAGRGGLGALPPAGLGRGVAVESRGSGRERGAAEVFPAGRRLQVWGVCVCPCVRVPSVRPSGRPAAVRSDGSSERLQQ